MESIISDKNKVLVVIVLIIGVLWHVFLLTSSPLYLKKYTFDNNELSWKDIYSVGDTLIFSDGQNIDMFIVHDKHFYTPRNRFGFDWENWNIFYIINVSDELHANVGYEFIIYHDGQRKLGKFNISKRRKQGIGLTSSIGGYLITSSYEKTNILDTITIIPKNGEPFFNKLDYQLDGLEYYKLSPNKGIVKYGFDDNRIYNLVEVRHVSL